MKTLNLLFLVILCFMNTFPKKIILDSQAKVNINEYSESIETINNPGAGYTTTVWITSKPGQTKINNPVGNLVLFFICISGFSSGSNGSKDDDGNYIEGTDYDLDDTFFEGLRGNLENVRRNGGTAAIRFRYDENGKTNPEPSTFNKVLFHIGQIKESGILEEYKDILMFIESGFVGAWGEQHSGKYTSVEYKAQLLEAVLDMTPDNIPVTVRVPNTFAKFIGIPLNEIDFFISEKGTKEARVGLYNDGYMGSDTDLGTFSNRLKETNWLSNQNKYTYYGGEFSGNLEWAQKYNTYLPENAIPEMYKTHLSYINSNIYNLYKNYEFKSAYSVNDVDNTAYYGQTVFKFIRDHLGYRFVLRYSEITSQIQQGGTLEITAKIENTGFANPIKEQKAEILLEKNGNYIKTQIDIDSTEFYSCETHEINILLKIPGGIEIGVWNIYLKLSVGKSNINDFYMRSVQFANENIWNSALGANKIGSVEIISSTNQLLLTDNYFYQTNTDKNMKSNGELLTANNTIIIDGKNSGGFEWKETNLLIEKDNKKLYITNDENYLYIMADMKQNATAPVFNLQLYNGNYSVNYWLYYQSNGFIYFNKGTCLGCIFKNVGNISEFKIPFGNVMNITAGTLIKSVRIFVQDSDNNWDNIADIKSGEYTVQSTFSVFSAFRNIYLKKNDNYTLNVETILQEPKYQWLLNDYTIKDANKKEYIIQNASINKIGVYSVKITSNTGIEKIVKICNLIDVL